MALLTAFSFLERQKKRKKDAAGMQGGGMAGGWVRMTAAGCRGGRRGGWWSWWWWYGAATIKVYLYTAFEAVNGGGMDYFCTVPTLHRRRRWNGSRGRDADGSQAARLEGGLAAAAGRRYPPIDSDGRDDMSV